MYQDMISKVEKQRKDGMLTTIYTDNQTNTPQEQMHLKQQTQDTTVKGLVN